MNPTPPGPVQPAHPDDEADVVAAARRRGRALAQRDEPELRLLLHPLFHWQSHRGEQFDLETYLASNLRRVAWVDQQLIDPHVEIVGDTAVLHCTVVDVVAGPAGDEIFRMPMTQTWVREGGAWRLLAGHAGPRHPER